ncbi:hypothetical protein ABPG74_004368 [Tetrahymena malaccensis]
MFGNNQGGLFGNTQQPAGGGGLFGQPSQPSFGQTGATGGGLFGGATNTFGGGGGGGGLFGGNPQQTNPTAGGGMFGQGATGLGGAPAQTGGGLFGAPQNNTQGGGLFGGGAATGGGMFGNTANNQQGGGGLFGAPSQPTSQPPAFSLNNPTTGGGGGLFGQPANNMGGNNGGLFGGTTTAFGGNNGMLGNANRPQGNGIFGGAATTANTGTAGIFGGMGANNNNGGGLFGGMNNANNNTTGGAFGATNPTTGGGGLFGGGATTGGGGLFGGNNTQGGGLLGTANTTAGGLLGGGFNMNNNTGGILGQTNNQFGLGSFGSNNNAAAAPFQPKASANAALTKPNEKNLCYAISNGTDFCIIELALTQRKLVKAGQLKPGAQQAGGMFGQPAVGLGQPAQGGGLFGGATTATTPFGGTGNAPLFGGQNTQAQGGGLFGAGTNNAAQGGGGLFGAKPGAATTGGGLFGQMPAQTGGFLGATNTATQPAGGGLFGGATTTQAPGGGGLFGGNTTGTATGGGLFGGNQQAGGATGGLFGGQQPNNQGGLFLNTTNTNNTATGGGLFGGANTTPATGGGLFGGANTTQPGLNTGGGLFGANTGASQPQAQGGLFGGAAPQQNGLFGGATAGGQTGGLFGGATGAPQQQGGGLFGQTASNPTQGGGLFGATNTGLGAAAAGTSTAQTGLNGFQTLIQLLEQSQNQNNDKLALDDDTEQTWVYGKLREGYQGGSLGYFQSGDSYSSSGNKFIQLEQQSLYGYQKKKQAYNQYKNLALRDEKEKKDEMKKLLSSFSSSFVGIGSEQKKSNNLSSQSQALPIRQRKLSGSSEVSQVGEKLKVLEKNDIFIDFIKSRTSNRIRIPVKPRYTYGDVKYKILNELINDTELNVRNFRLQARVKGPNKAPKPLRDTETVFNNKNLAFENIDYIELVERSGNLSSLNETLNNNNSFVLNNIPNDEADDRNSLQNNSRVIDSRSLPKSRSQSIILPFGFSSMPSVDELEKFTEKQLSKVENFVLENDFARIVFQEPVNLYNLDLSQLIFEETKISLEQISDSDRLNKKCIIEFKKFGLKQLNSGKSKEEVKSQVEKLIKKKNLQLVKPYDVDNTKLVYIQDKFY